MGLFVYITAPAQEAEQLAAMLVERRLAAGVNIVPGMRSVYRWQGSVHRAQESVLLAKTETDRLDALIQAVRDLHSYETPCIAAWPVEYGFPPFLDWLRTQTRSVSAETEHPA